MFCVNTDVKLILLRKVARKKAREEQNREWRKKREMARWQFSSFVKFLHASASIVKLSQDMSGFNSNCCPQVGELWPGTTCLPKNSSRAAPACCSRSREEVVPRPCLLNLPRPVGAGGLAVQTRSLHLRTLLRPEEHGERC